MKLLTRSGAVLDKILGSLFVLACILLVFIMLAVVVDVVMRYSGMHPILGVNEIVEYSLLFITFLAAAWILKKEGHIRISIVLDWLNPRPRATINTLTSIVAVIIWAVIAWYSGQVTWDLFQAGEHIGASLLEPLKAPLVAIIFVGSFLLFIQSLRKTHGYLRSRRLSPKQE